MIGVARITVKGSDKPLEIRACSEIQDMVSGLSYLNCFSECLKAGFSVKPKVFYKDVSVNYPKNGTMSVSVEKKTKIFFGKTEELMAVYILANQYQRGENLCSYCNRPDSRCQIKGFLNELETV